MPGAGAAMAADSINRFWEAEHKKKLELARASRPGGGMAGGPKAPRALGAAHQKHLNQTRGAGGVIGPLMNNAPPTSSTVGKRRRKRDDEDS